MTEELKTKGYIIFKNQLNKNELKQSKSCFKKELVNYTKLEEKVNTKLIINNINKNLNFNLKNIKYRASNNNNSSDAGFFHRDIHNYSNEKLVNIYTALLYLDNSTLEIIPGSHTKILNPIQALLFFFKKKQINLKEGDILLFHGTLLHRGIFRNKVQNRRLIQLFDCVNDFDYNKYVPKILHIPCGNKCNNQQANLSIKISFMKVLPEILNFINYFNVMNGYGLKNNLLDDIKKDKDIKYISTESQQNRLTINNFNNTFQKNNLYILNSSDIKNMNNINDIDNNLLSKFNFKSNILNNIYLFIYLIIFIVILKKL